MVMTANCHKMIPRNKEMITSIRASMITAMESLLNTLIFAPAARNRRPMEA